MPAIDKTPFIPAIRYAVRELSRRGDTEEIRAKVENQIREGCENHTVTEAEMSVILSEARDILAKIKGS